MAQATESWTFTSHAVPGSVDDRGWQALIRHIEQAAGDRIEIKALLRGEGGTETAYLSHLRRGRVNLSTASFASSAAIVPEVAVLSLPYLFDTQGEIDFIVDEFLDGIFRELFAAKGLVLVRWLDVGWIHLATRDALSRPASLSGKRIRAPASPAARLFLTRVGADVAVLPFADIVPGLDTGLIDGAVTTTIMYDGLLKDTAPHFLLTRHSYEVGFLLANRRWYAQLDPADRRLISEGYPDTAEFRQAMRTDLVGITASMVNGGWASSPSDADLALWRQAAAGDNYNYGTQSFPGNEAPGISVFLRDGDGVYLTYQTFSRGLDMLNGAYHMLDLTPRGRDESEVLTSR